MKNIILPFSLTLLALNCFAEQLSPSESLSRAFSTNLPSGVMTAPANNLRLIKTESFNGINTIYVYASPSQTLFLGADDVAQPILGVLDTPVTSLENMPPNMQWWLSEYSRKIEWASKRFPSSPSIYSYALTNAASNASSNSSYADISPLVKTKWNQDAPYNDKTPRVSGKATYTGCVATAMAQVMKYHEWPEVAGKGEGTATANNVAVNPIQLDTLQLDWKNMLNVYTSSASKVERNAVATLMKACGYSVNMMYGTNGSGAYPVDLVGALVDKFGYDVGADIYYRDYYSYDAWVDLIYDDLIANRPVIYGGSGESGGHQFVFDGFKASDKSVHVNWGWGGYMDGYFKVDALVPEGQGAGGNNGEGYNSGQSAVFGVQRPQAGSKPHDPYLAVSGTLSCTISGQTVRIQPTQGVFNISGRTGYFYIGARLKKVDSDVVVKTIEVKNGEIAPRYGFRYFDVVVGTLADGTYDLYPAYKLANTDWKDIPTEYYSNKFVRIKVVNGVMEQVSSIDNLEITTDLPEKVAAGSELTVNATVKNNGARDAVTTIYAVICKMNGTELKGIVQFGQGAKIEAGANSSADFQIKGLFPASLTAGEHYLAFVTSEEFVLDAVKINVTAPPSFQLVKVNPYNTTFVSGNPYRIEVQIKNISTSSKNLDLSLDLINSNGNKEYNLLKISRAIGAGITSSINASGTAFPSLTTGKYKILISTSDNSINDMSTEITVENSSAISDIISDNDSKQADYYNLKGIKVDHNTTSEKILIKQSSGKVSKILK